ncbi:hypothetical protein TRFO_40465 [Tritrichomonas foetus]|uniref:BEACH domain-containing protein n=1 Tax=Tritrichomonas foetus TaxID=1144522 RepID=A0A1J4J505_9EUKA|nr:hypothetical protein TRFO_40465 [Tritrichomonas foetus]|eukprot:OHS93239.1 hypothetical protein TRFO_40465 [Tritrichomonas foetus]
MELKTDPIFGILCLKPSVRIPSEIDFLASEDKAFGELPEFSRSELRELYSKVGQEKQNHLNFTESTDIFQKLNFDFPFRPDLIPLILGLDEKSDPNFRYRSRFILFTFIAWQCNPIIEHAPVVIHSLTEILNSPVSDHSLRAIERCFQISFIRSRLDDFEIVFPLFKRFFNKSTEYALKIQKLITQYLKALQISSQNQGQKYTNEIAQYLSFLLSFVKKYPAGLEPQTINDILLLSTDRFAQLDQTALEIFVELSENASKDVVVSLAMLFPTPLKNMMEQEPPFLVLTDENSNPVNIFDILKDRKTIDIPPFSQNIKSQFQYVPVETFKNGLDIQTALNLSEKPSFKSLYRLDLLKRVHLIAKAMRPHEAADSLLFDWVASTFKDMQPDSPYYYDFVMMFIAFYRYWRFQSQSNIFWDTIFNSILFDDRFNAVIDGSVPQLIDQIRSIIIATLVKDHGFALLSYAFETCSTKPALVAEMLHRILVFFDKIDLSNLKKIGLIRTIAALALYFQDINFNHDFKNILPFIETSRTSLFLFISRVLQNKELCVCWMEYPIFCSSFLKFVYEPPIRQFVLLHVKYYLLDEDSSISTMVIDSIRDICSFVFDRIPQEQYVMISCEMLQAINEFLTHRSEHVGLFVDMTESICSAVNSLDFSNVCGDFLVQAIHFFAVSSSIEKLDDDLITSITESTKKIYGNEPTNAIFSKFVQLIAGTQLSSVSPSFIIKQPIALLPLVEIYRNSSQLKEILTFIHSLLSYSYSNAIAANESNFDANLLEFINSHKYDNDYDPEVIELLFSIISLICCAVGSAPVIQKFIDLMSPIKGKFLSKYEPLYIQKMTEIISATMNAPMAFLPLNGKSTHIKLKNMMASNIEKYFTIVFWVFVDQPSSQSRMSIFKINDIKYQGISAFVSAGQLLLTITNKTIESTARCEAPLPVRDWTPVMIRVSFVNNKTYIIPIVENYTCRRLEFAWKGFKEGELEFTIGNSPDEPIENVSHVFLASFALYNDHISNEEMPRFYDSGPRQSIREFQNAQFSLHLSNNKGNIGITTTGEVNAEMIGNNVRCHPSFCDVLLSVNKAELFLPLFSFFDYPTTEHKFLQEVPELSFDLIMATLSISEEVQEAFYMSKGFQIMSHLLSNSNNYHPSYATYIRFYTMFQSLSYEPLQRSLIDHILTNFNLLFKFEKSIQGRIVKHWARVLMPAYPNLIAEVKPIRQLLSAVQQHFTSFDQKTENIRKYLFSMMEVIAIGHMNKEDLEILISFAVQCQVERSIEILLLLLSIIQCECESRQVLQENSILFFNLHKLAKINNEELFLLLLDLIYELHYFNIIEDITTQQHYDMLLPEIPSNLISEDILLGVIDRINKNVFELLPIACFIAINLDEDYIVTLFTSINPHNLSIVSRYWVLGIAAISPPDIRTKILKFILRCPTSEWSEIFYSFEVISSIFDDDHLSHELILLLAQELIHVDSHPDYDSFYQFATSTIFFHQKTQTRVMEEEFEHSPFSKYLRNKRKDNPKQIKQESFRNLRSCSVTLKLNQLRRISNDSIICDSSESDLHVLSKVASPLRTARRPFQDKPVQQQMSSCTTTSDSDSMIGHDIEKKFKYNANWLSTKTESYSDVRIEKVFLIRTDKNGRWLDCDIAIWFMRLFMKWSNPLFLNYALLTISYLMKFHNSSLEIESFLNNLSLTVAQKKTHLPLLHLIKRNAEKFKKNLDLSKISFMPTELNALLAFEALKQFSQNRNKLLDALHLFNNAKSFNKTSEKTESLLKETEFMNSELIDEIYVQAISRFINSEKTQREICNRQWNRYWRIMTFQMAPWESAVVSTSHTIFERDLTLSNNLIPFRMRRKLQFDVITDPNTDADADVEPSTPLPHSPENSPQGHIVSYDCHIITPGREKPAILEISSFSKTLRFITDQRTHTILGDTIRYLIQRDRFNQQNSFELVLYSGKSFYIDLQMKSLPIMKEISEIATKIEIPLISNPSIVIRTTQLTQLWVAHSIPTFNYIIFLNMLAGRSFNDITQYPIFPWILSDYSSKTLDFNDPSIYRDFSQCLTSGMNNYAPSYQSYVNASLRRIPYKEKNDQELKSVAEMFDQHHGALEIIPEFFFFPECLIAESGEDFVDLPIWAEGSPMKFIYLHRKLLESDVVSNTIHRWFDYTFGIDRPVQHYPSFMSDDENDPETKSKITEFGKLPHQIFFSPHPTRQPLISTSSSSSSLLNQPPKLSSSHSSSSFSHSSSSFSPTSKIGNQTTHLKFPKLSNLPKQKVKNEIRIKTDLEQAYYAIFDVDQLPKTLETSIIANEGIVKTFEIDLNDISTKQQQQQVSIRNTRTASIDGSHIAKVDILDTIVPLNEGFLASNGQESLLLIYENHSTMREIRAPFGNIRALASSGKYFATVGNDMTTRIFLSDKPDMPIFSNPSYRGETTCAAISQNFNIFVFGSIDGTLQICSLSSGIVQKIVNIEYKPLHVIISENWGFIVAFCEKRTKQKRRFELLLYNINGLYIGSKKVENELMCWETWTDNKGFDWLAFSMKGGKIFTFELYTMEFNSPLYRSKKEIISLKYAGTINSLVLVNTSGEIIIKSLLPDDNEA